MNDTKIASKAKAQLSNAACHPRSGCQPFLKGRSVISWKGMHYVHDLARECIMRHSHHVTFDSHSKECNVPISLM